MSSQSVIDKDSDEKYQRDNDGQTEKLGIMSSQSCIEKDYDERDHGQDGDETEKKNSGNDKERLTGKKQADKRDNIYWVYNNKSDERYQRYNDDEIEKKILKMIKKH